MLSAHAKCGLPPRAVSTRTIAHALMSHTRRRRRRRRKGQRPLSCRGSTMATPDCAACRKIISKGGTQCWQCRGSANAANAAKAAAAHAAAMHTAPMHTAPLHTARKAIAVTGGGRVGSCAQGGDLNEMLGIAPARLTIALQVNGADALHDKLASASLSDARASPQN